MELHDVEAVREPADTVHEAPGTLQAVAAHENKAEGYRADIDGLRAVAVVAVCHVAVPDMKDDARCVRDISHADE